MNGKSHRLTAVVAALALSGSVAAQTSDPHVAELQRQLQLLNLKVDMQQAREKLATPSTAKSFEARSGAVEGAEKLGFEMYVATLGPTMLVAGEICKTVAARIGEPPAEKRVYVSTGTAPPAFAAAIDRYHSLGKRLDEAARRAQDLADTFRKEFDAFRSRPPAAPRDSLAPKFAETIGVAAGVITGIAGFANLFRTERTIGAVDNIVGVTELRVALAQCLKGKGLATLDVDSHLLSDAELEAPEGLKKVEHAARGMAELMLEIRQQRENEKVEARRKRLEQMHAELSTIHASAQSILDSFYAPASDTGISPALTYARARWLQRQLRERKVYRLTLTIGKAAGNTQTVKWWIGNDDVYTAGGISVAYSLHDGDGTPLFEELAYATSGWRRIKVDDDAPGQVVRWAWQETAEPRAGNAVLEPRR